MAAIRRDITANAIDADRFVQGALGLKAEASGMRASELGIDAGPIAADRDLSTWDLFVVWHVWAMDRMSADGQRNAAHMGPVFLPWHRWYLLVIEANMRRILGVGRDDFGLPYWDWAADGSNLTAARQRTRAKV
jgi:tyrosinase